MDTQISLLSPTSGNQKKLKELLLFRYFGKFTYCYKTLLKAN